MSTATITESLAGEVIRRVETILSGTPVYALEVVVRGRHGSRVLDVYLDSDEALGVDQLADISRQLGLLLDAEEVVDGSYRLNVSTPGLDRPLVPRQFAKHVGRLVRVRMGVEDGSERSVEGVIGATDGASLVVHEASGLEIHVPYEAIQEAKVVLPW